MRKTTLSLIILSEMVVKDMKTIGLKMNILMSVTLSFSLSLTGTLLSGHFTVKAFLLGFALSTFISFLIGIVVPIKKIGDGLAHKFGLDERSMPARLISALASDIIYTPILTLSMVVLAHRQAAAHGNDIPFVPMLLRALAVSLIVAYIIILIVTPVFIRLVLKKYGAGSPPADKK